ncbi:flagellar hook-length control protein FliK [Paenibacillus sp. OV219]|uniref:flagellar hook-length control protein FliK n=1 Tax=Paenibacillus sp. OV219 TaxID=1884377 RepID=UPI0008ACACA8|nr:flagellar hook-length control protein FliK [Paenibacillus sp. OV219]SEN32019.1 Flagellar hook-length control protein FliK [Paenibacillus sp. OV219]
MQMSVSNAPTSVTPAGATAAPSAAKGGDNAAFVQTLAQTLAGSPAANAGGETTGDAAVMPKTPANLLASLLGGNLSKEDLLAAIDSLLKQLDDTDAEQLANTTTEGNLTDALVQLDSLMSLLTGMPMANQQQPDAQSDFINMLSADGTGDQAGTADTMLGVIAALTATGTQAATEQTTAQLTETSSDAKSANVEVIAALKSGLQETLSDLRALLQQSKSGGAAGRDQNVLISKQLIATEQLLSGTKPDLQAAIKALTESAGSEQVDTIRSVQTASVTTNSHLQRMSHQLLHVGLLKVVPKAEDQQGQAGRADSQQQLNALNAPTVTLGQDLRRTQLTSSREVIQQPVPVNQFASTVQGLVVKQFQVSSGNGISQAQLTLNPEHLGQVNVNISIHGGVVTAQFLTDTVAAKDMLENQLAQLRSTLQSQGLQVDKLEVSQTAAQTNLFQEHDRNGQSGREQGTSGRGGSSKETDLDFNTDLEELTLEQAVDQDLGLGRGIHTTA